MTCFNNAQNFRETNSAPQTLPCTTHAHITKRTGFTGFVKNQKILRRWSSIPVFTEKMAEGHPNTLAIGDASRLFTFADLEELENACPCLRENHNMISQRRIPEGELESGPPPRFFLEILWKRCALQPFF